MKRDQKALLKKAKAKAQEIKKDKSIKRAERLEQAEQVIKQAEQAVAASALLNPLASGIISDGFPCCICGAPIRLGQYHRIIGYKGDTPYARHESCAPGTDKWFKSEAGQKSPNAKYFKEVVKDEHNGNDGND